MIPHCQSSRISKNSWIGCLRSPTWYFAKTTHGVDHVGVLSSLANSFHFFLCHPGRLLQELHCGAPRIWWIRHYGVLRMRCPNRFRWRSLTLVAAFLFIILAQWISVSDMRSQSYSLKLRIIQRIFLVKYSNYHARRFILCFCKVYIVFLYCVFVYCVFTDQVLHQ